MMYADYGYAYEETAIEQALASYMFRNWEAYDVWTKEIKRTLTKKPIDATALAIATNKLCANWSYWSQLK